jgi:hypothetical protein
VWQDSQQQGGDAERGSWSQATFSRLLTAPVR